MMRTTIMVIAALLAVAGMQFPNAALALNPQPEVPSRPNPDVFKNENEKGKKENEKGKVGCLKCGKSHKHTPPSKRVGS